MIVSFLFCNISIFHSMRVFSSFFKISESSNRLECSVVLGLVWPDSVQGATSVSAFSFNIELYLIDRKQFNALSCLL